MKNKRLPADQMFVKGFQELLEVMLSNPFMSYLDYDSVRIDLFETEQSFIVEAELLGYHPKDIIVQIQADHLQLTAKKYCIREFYDEKQGTLAREQMEESVERTIDFPFPLMNKKITATFSNEILEITISKHETNESNQQIVPIEFQ
ncbi:Hsp20/alpha crystallin family protein [Priestia megaterium]|uniref:Hsp20/alpha crystallin family protein n=1 Tax=Priestia megaterium TaxID=1404 RepID=A0ABD4X124_PRIMG|nr:Hsp20/alpha crystallin family protein [Priestia megaterium]MDD9786185.1 Hsp20/alpha crystallin family protein [Priestia megaterium]